MRAIAEIGSVYLRCRRREEMGLFPRKEMHILKCKRGEEKEAFPKLAIGEKIKRFGRPLSPLRRGVGFSMLP